MVPYRASHACGLSMQYCSDDPSRVVVYRERREAAKNHVSRRS